MKDHTRREFIKLGFAATVGPAFAYTWPRRATQVIRPQEEISLRYSCFYQVGRNVIDLYSDPEFGLPNDEGHLHVFAHSHATAVADRGLADYIHNAGSSFRYAPCFDLHKYLGWYTAGDDQLAAWARDFRDAAMAAGADYFGFNELPSNASDDEHMRSQIATLLSYLDEPAEDGNQLGGIFFMTHRPSMPANWSGPASDFWQRVDETCALVVAEHYHGHGFICNNSELYLSNHFFAMDDWLSGSGEPAKINIADGKFTVLHSSRYGPGPSGWQGGDSNVISLEEFHRNLSRCARVTRNRAGGFNRIAFAPLASVYTDPAVHSRIRLLLRWHYNQDGQDSELLCVEGSEAECRCPA